MLFFRSSNKKPLSVIEAGNLLYEKQFLHPRRCLDFFVLLVGVEGTMHILQDHIPYTLEPGKFLILMPHHLHEGFLPSEGKVSYYWCHFYAPEPYEILTEGQVAPILRTFENPTRMVEDYLLPIEGTFHNFERVMLEFHQILDFSLQRVPFSASTDYAASILAIELTHEFLSQRQQTAVSRIFSNLNDLQEYIRIHYSEDLTVSMLAQHFGYNSNYLSTAFKKATGESLVHFINKTRISFAKALLLQTNDPINVIAEKVGFNDSKYFIRIFRTFVGATPSMFRLAYYRKHINVD